MCMVDCIGALCPIDCMTDIDKLTGWHWQVGITEYYRRRYQQAISHLPEDITLEMLL